MGDLRERVRRHLDRLQPSPGGLERTLARVRQRRRNRRLGAGALGLLLAAALIAGLLTLARPAHRPAGITPVGLIAFSRGGPDGGIYVMNPDGTGLTRLTSVSGDAQPAWSPDGSEIAFVRFQDGNEDIYVMRSDGGGVHRLTADGASSSPAWSPDGTRIAVARETPGNADIYLMDPDGTHVTNLTNDPLREYTPAWSPDGTRIAFTGYSAGPPPSPDGLYVMNADGTGIRRIGPDDAAWPAWSPDAGRIAFVDTGSRTLDVINADGTGLREIVHLGGFLPGEIPPIRPTWSPDGTRIAFAAGSDASSTHIYVVNADGTGLEPLTSDTHPDQDPAWSAPSTWPSPSVVPSPSPVKSRCVRAQTSGDFDGDGKADQAEFVVIDWGDVSCSDEGAVVQHFQSQELVVRFGSGQTLDRTFPTAECSGGECASIFEATDLDGDGRDELAIDVGPGADVAFMEINRVDPTSFHPLVIAEPGDPPYLKPGPAAIGGGFDSVAQSPVECRVSADGTRELVSIHAELKSGPVSGPWDVHTTVLALHGDQLVVASSSDTKEPLTAFAGPPFRNGCP